MVPYVVPSRPVPSPSTPIQTVAHTGCADTSCFGDLYDYGHGRPTVILGETRVDGPWLRVELARSTRIRLTMRLALRARRPSYRTPFDRQGPAA